MYHLKERMKVIGKQETKVLRLFRSVVASQASRPLAAHENQKRSETYMIANNRLNEIESQKAFVRAVSNSDKWKAGGAY